MDRLKEMKELFSESYGTLNPLYMKMLESNNMYSSQQWTEADARNSKAKNIKPSVYNFLKKNVDVLVGIQRQNRPALKVLPEESGDNIRAGIASIMLHHAMRKGNGYMAVSQSMKDQIMMGLSWLSPHIDFSRDAINGDLRVVAESPFDIWFDPGTKEMDLSDCGYIIKRKAVSKNVAKAAYPKFANEIEDSKADYKSDFFVLDEAGLKDKCVIKELWQRKPVPHYTIAAKGKIITLSKDEYNKRQADIEILKQVEGYTELQHSKFQMTLLITVNDIIVYDGVSIYKGDFYPFIPVWGFYNKSADSWSLKLQGLLECLKDSQMEYNKVSSSITHYMLSSIHSGWQMDKNAVDDIRVLTKGMSAPVIQVNPGKNIQRIQPPSMPDMMFNYRNESMNNMMRIGLNAESLGFQSGVESIKGMKMKTMQGMATVGELVDNFNYAFINLGKISLSIMYQFYSIDKMKRILGEKYQWITQEDMLDLQSMEHDIEVDDTSYSPVQKMYRLETKLNAAQYGVTGFEAEDFYDDLDLDPEDQMKMKQRAEAKKAMEEQQQAQTAEVQNLLTATKAESEKAKTDNMNVQTQLMGTNVLKNINELSGGASEDGENES